jgi:hypothetical protein
MTDSRGKEAVQADVAGCARLGMAAGALAADFRQQLLRGRPRLRVQRRCDATSGGNVCSAARRSRGRGVGLERHDLPRNGDDHAQLGPPDHDFTRGRSNWSENGALASSIVGGFRGRRDDQLDRHPRASRTEDRRLPTTSRAGHHRRWRHLCRGCRLRAEPERHLWCLDPGPGDSHLTVRGDGVHPGRRLGRRDPKCATPALPATDVSSRAPPAAGAAP